MFEENKTNGMTIKCLPCTQHSEEDSTATPVVSPVINYALTNCVCAIVVRKNARCNNYAIRHPQLKQSYKCDENWKRKV